MICPDFLEFQVLSYLFHKAHVVLFMNVVISCVFLLLIEKSRVLLLIEVCGINTGTVSKFT